MAFTVFDDDFSVFRAISDIIFVVLMLFYHLHIAVSVKRYVNRHTIAFCAADCSTSI